MGVSEVKKRTACNLTYLDVARANFANELSGPVSVVVASSRSRFARWQRGIFDPKVDKRPAAHQVLLDAAREACHLVWRKLRPGVVFYARGAACSFLVMGWDPALCRLSGK